MLSHYIFNFDKRRNLLSWREREREREKLLVAASEVGTLHTFAFPFGWGRSKALVIKTWGVYIDACIIQILRNITKRQKYRQKLTSLQYNLFKCTFDTTLSLPVSRMPMIMSLSTLEFLFPEVSGIPRKSHDRVV